MAGGIVLAVALVHIVRLGSYLRGTPSILYYSYVSDVIVPLAMYFVLLLSDAQLPFLRPRRTKAALVFGAASSAEIVQALGVPILGNTFDPLDFVMFAVGVAAAVLLDTIALPAAGRRAPS